MLKVLFKHRNNKMKKNPIIKVCKSIVVKS